MPQLSSGQTASLVLDPGQSYTISTTGSATVKGIYGAPATTTTLTANFATFGPYGVPAKLDIACTSGAASYTLDQYEGDVVRSKTNPITGVISLSGGNFSFTPIQNASFAALPPAAANTGVIYRVTDAANSLWESNGTRWRPVNGKAILKTMPTEFSMSGTSAVKAFEAIIPAGLVKDGDTLQMRYTLSKSGTSETCTINVRLGTAGTAADTALSSFGPLATTNISAGILVDYKRLSATSMRKVGNGANNSAYAGNTTAAINTPVTVSSLDAAASYLTIWMANSAAAEAATLHDCVVELVTG